jgi:hypothetical protein
VTFGKSGSITINPESPSIVVEDREGYSSILGQSDLVVPATGKKEHTPAASLVLLGKDKKVMWSAP